MSASQNNFFALIQSAVHTMVPAGTKVILYGSQARGTMRKDSDWDLLILLNKDKIEDSDFDTISYPLIEFGWENGEQVSPKLYTVADWEKRRFTLFYKNVGQEGVAL